MEKSRFDSLMSLLWQSEQHIEYLMALGGPIMWPLLAVSVLLWTLTLERYWFMLHTVPRLFARSTPETYTAAITLILTVEMALALRRHLRLIKTLSAILPMLGLLGTVTGIVETFDLIRVFGSAESRVVARGISQALITTLAGLVMGLFGVGVGYDLNRRAVVCQRRYGEYLRQP